MKSIHIQILKTVRKLGTLPEGSAISPVISANPRMKTSDYLTDNRPGRLPSICL